MNSSSTEPPDTSSVIDKSKNDISQSTPVIQENIHGTRIFSVDDDPEEVKHDIRYLEGLHDGFHYALHTQRSRNALSAVKSAPNIDSSINNNSPGNATTTTVQRSRPKQHRSISRLAILTTPDSGIGFDLNNSIRHEISENDLNLLEEDNNNNNTNHNNNITVANTLLDNISDRYVIHDTSFQDHKTTTNSNINNNELIIEEIPPASNHTNDQDLELNILNTINQLNNNDDRVSTTSSIESFTLKERQDAINKTHPFGIRIWKPALYKKQRSVQRTADEDIHETKLKHISVYVHLSNLVWSLTMGLALFAIFILASILVLVFGGFTQSSRDYSKVFFNLSKYLLWPFGKVVYLLKDEHYLKEDRGEGISVPQFYKWVTSYGNRLFFHQSQSLSPTVSRNERLQYPSYGSIPFPNNQQQQQQNTVPGCTHTNNSASPAIEDDTLQQRRFFGRGEWTLGRIIFYTLFHLILEPIVMIFALITWLFVFTIPMSNILWNLLYHLRKHPLALGFKNIQNSSTTLNNVDNGTNKNILLCTFRCAGWHYYKFTVDGTNIIVVNLIFLVFFTIFDFFVLKSYFNINNVWLTEESSIFILCLASIIPLAFYIGQAVASISAQTSMGVGAVINAFFSTIVEIYLYCIALKRGEGPLVEGSIIGSILGAVLLLPGLSMCGGAWNRKTQRYNPASAGVSSALLIFSTIVLYVPTIIHEIYGEYTVICLDRGSSNYNINSCSSNTNNNKTVYDLTVKSATMAMFSDQCYFRHPPLRYDNMYTKVIQPMSVSCAIVLFLAYIIGLWFTLRTHAKLIWELPITEQVKESSTNVEDGEHCLENDRNAIHEGHEAPNWSRSKSTYILLIATLLYAVIAEILVACVDSVLEDFPGLNPKFLGLTIFALVPNTTEFLNAISFAVHGNVALSMEIGTAYALQVCQLQIPALILYSIIYTWNIPRQNINIKKQMFTLIFPKWDLIGSFAGIFMFTYLYAEGKSNYFKGSMLILIYVIVILGFFYQGALSDGSFDPWNV